jgi:hypothetical protein
VREGVQTRVRGSYHGPGFILALSVRLLTSALAIVIPLYAVSALGAPTSEAGVFVLLLWVGNAVGVVAAVIALRNQSYSSVAGFCVVALSLAGVAEAGKGAAPIFMLTSGVGVGLPQPFLSAFMHEDSGPRRPFSGLGLYSTALGVGLILGPLIAYGAFPLGGFAGVFLALAGVCALGVAGAAFGHGRVASRPKPSIPSPSTWLRSLGGSVFRRAIVVNFLYSLLLPVFLSYGAIYAENRFGFTPTSALLLFTGVFTFSVLLRLTATEFEARLDRLLVISASLLVLSTLVLGLAPSWPYLVLGMLLFSLPQAYIFPIANYFALTSAKDDMMNASYLFQASSAAAEFITPAAAVGIILWTGLQGLFLIGTVLAVGALIACIYPSRTSGVFRNSDLSA